MIETILIWAIIALCAFFTGRRFFRQWQAATSKDKNFSCSHSCTCCADSSCSSRNSAQNK